MRRRLDLGASLVGAPRLLLLDEPTTGLDPRSRIDLWDAIRGLVAHGTDVLLTTQYLDEADQLADRIAVIDRGTVIAEGTPGQLKASIGLGSLHVRLIDPAQRPEAERLLGERLGDVHLEADPAALSVPCSDADRGAEAVAELSRSGVRIADFALGQPTLDEVFLALTGRPAEEDEEIEEMAA
jgi:ABC-2 type transport system ATP-binding protein